MADQAGTEATKRTSLDRQPPHLPTTISYTFASAYFLIFHTSHLAIFHWNVDSNRHVLIFAKLVFKNQWVPETFTTLQLKCRGAVVFISRWCLAFMRWTLWWKMLADLPAELAVRYYWHNNTALPCLFLYCFSVWSHFVVTLSKLQQGQFVYSRSSWFCGGLTAFEDIYISGLQTLNICGTVRT